jgi:3-hydroxybutyryl-CoA dehydratase
MTNDVRNLIGKVFVAHNPVVVRAEMIIGFCAAIGETNPLYVDAEFAQKGPYGRIIAPLSIAGSFRAAEDIFDYLPPNERRLLGSMELEFLAPIGAGDIITIASEVAEVYEKTGRSGGLTFIVIRSTLTNQDGMIVTRIDHRFTARKGRPRPED